MSPEPSPSRYGGSGDFAFMDLRTKLAIASLVVSGISLVVTLAGGIYALGIFRGEFNEMKKRVDLLLDVHVRNGVIPPEDRPAARKAGNGGWPRWATRGTKT